ncbi:MAG: DRTGG domain-containing protein [Bacillota bacterium]
MRISEIVRLLGAEIVCGKQNLEVEVSSACGADLMSDVLAHSRSHMLLLTGMTNLHVIRTAEVLDIDCITFVRGKKVPPEIIELAEGVGMTILSTAKTLYTACGLLYQAGLRGTAGDACP